jgi:hypothetical protein
MCLSAMMGRKMPDVVLFWKDRNWLMLIESVTSHGPVDGKRHEELLRLFEKSTAGLVYVTAFPSRAAMAKYLGVIAWETEVWTACADASDPLQRRQVSRAALFMTMTVRAANCPDFAVL